jgi:IS1 family transposase
VVGGRDAATCQRLYDKVKHVTDGIFDTDDWDACATILPPARHVIGKTGPITIEQDHSNTGHHLGRMTRRTKVVSKKEEMVYTAIKLWCALTQPITFAAFQQSALSIFR